MTESTPEPTVADFLASATSITDFAGCVEAYLEEDLHVLILPSAAPYTENVLPWIDGPVHKYERRMISRLFTKPALTVYERDLLTPSVERCIAEAANGRSPDGIVRADLLEVASVSLVMIAARITGLDGVDDIGRARALLATHDTMLEAITGRWATGSADDADRAGRAEKRRFYADYFAPALARRRHLVEQAASGEIDAEDVPLDLLTLMLQEPDPAWDEDLPVRACILLLVASVSSTASSIVHLVDDAATWFRNNPDDRDLVDDDEFLRGMINESLRLHAVTPAQVRRSVRDLTLPGGREVKEGEVLALVTGAANRDTSVFGEDAAVFDPRRYTRLPASVPPFGLAFGYGRHLCAGKPLVTTAKEQRAAADQFPLQRVSMRVLHALLAAGVELDPQNPPVHAESRMDRFQSYPVVFTRV